MTQHKLNKDQTKALDFIFNWWKSPASYMVLDGRGGVGKSFLVNSVLTELKGASPVLIAPTHEALAQLRGKIEGEYLFKTFHGALGIAPTTGEKELKFEQASLPKFWDEVNLIVLDEASMIDKWQIDLLKAIGCKVLYIGHKSQLPPIKLKRKLSDPCVSPVFEQGYPTYTLTTPMRNQGTLWDFNNLLEEKIYTLDKNIPSTFDIKSVDLKEYINSEEGKEDFRKGRTKIAMWSNDGVDRYNQRIRLVLHGEQAKIDKFIKGDKLILTKPLTVLSGLEVYTDKLLKQLASKKKEDFTTLYSNTKLEVSSISEVSVKLNYRLTVDCYRLLIISNGYVGHIYVPKHYDDYGNIGLYYEHIAWGSKDRKEREKLYRERHFILSCFAHVKHFYAATSHRLQGSSIDNIIVINSDIEKNSNKIEKSKCRYVACSRAINRLMFYRGI